MLFAGYMGLPRLRSPCNVHSCAQSAAQAVSIAYTFPTWFLHRTIDFCFGFNYFGEPELNIRLRNRVDYNSDRSLFILARQGDVDEMQKMLSRRSASPHDVSLRAGQTALFVSVHPAKYFDTSIDIPASVGT